MSKEGKSLRSRVGDMLYNGLTRQQIKDLIKSETQGSGETITVATLKEVDEILNSYPSIELIERIHKSILIRVNTADSSYIYDPATSVLEPIGLNQVKDILKAEYLRTKYKVCMLQYNPRVPKAIFEVDGISYFNPYQPPEWLKPHIMYGKPAEKHDMPEIYRKFFDYFFAGSKDSELYTLAWMSNSLRNRNQTYLTTIGAEGVGKGIVGEILNFLHGDSNYEKESQKFFTAGHNGHLHGKTMVYFDEIKMKNDDDINKMKALANPTLDIRKMYTEAATYKNYLNVYISSNNYDAIPQNGDIHRRYSLIDLNSIPMDKHPDWTDDLNKKAQELVNPQNLVKLAWYLWNYEKDPSVELDKVFNSSKKKEELKRKSLADWESHFLESFIPRYKDKAIPLTAVVDSIRCEVNDNKIKVTRNNLDVLSRKYPGLFSIRRLSRGSSLVDKLVLPLNLKASVEIETIKNTAATVIYVENYKGDILDYIEPNKGELK